ncbi:hypothetical protein BOTBODRAFT_264474 [Botryobasidium botryosum FD-172 SS1]|uniref:Uncharacterized protein n=1 Tax=Botryobasidium botryosum (strain FD-172 SS1) TaxID=930990 RepID=A0A067M3P5_BOTB1|nr:hypothetical protein BOTBODRAFT_264474 [Botryobasidium botryosum FD-172 SS1]
MLTTWNNDRLSEHSAANIPTKVPMGRCKRDALHDDANPLYSHDSSAAIKRCAPQFTPRGPASQQEAQGYTLPQPARPSSSRCGSRAPCLSVSLMSILCGPVALRADDGNHMHMYTTCYQPQYFLFEVGKSIPAAIRRLEQLLNTHKFNTVALDPRLNLPDLVQALTTSSAEPDPEVNQEGLEAMGDSEAQLTALARAEPTAKIYEEVQKLTENSAMTAAGTDATIDVAAYLITDNPRASITASPFDAPARKHLVSDKAIADGMEAVKALELRKRGLSEDSLRASILLSASLKPTSPIIFNLGHPERRAEEDDRRSSLRI